MKILISIVFAVLTAGCTATKRDVFKNSQREPQGRPVTLEWTEVKEFRWFHTLIRSDSTEKEVLKQIEQSGIPKYGNRWPLSKPTPDMLKKGIWVLKAGPGGPAPGFTSVRLTFADGRIVKIERYSGPMPA